jgi:DNA mismatch repair protein MutS
VSKQFQNKDFFMKNIFQKQILLSLTLLFCALTYPETTALETESKTGLYHQIIPLITKDINIPNPTSAQKLLLEGAEIFLKHGSNYAMVNSEVIQAITSIDFFTHILPQYLQPHTVSGTIQAALLTAQMTDDLDTLKYRQSIIQYFNAHPELLQELDVAFQQAKTGEEELLNSLTFNSKTVERFGYKCTVNEKLYFADQSYNNKYFLDVCKRIKTSNLILLPTIILAIIHVRIQLGIPFSAMIEGCNLENCKKAVNFMSENPMTTAGAVGALVGFGALNYVLQKPDVKQDFDLIYDQQNQLIKIATLIKQIEKINVLIDKDSDLKNLFSQELAKLQDLFNVTSTTTSVNLKYVISELRSSSFEGEPSYYFSKQGKVLATHYYLNECKAELIPYLEAFGKIDAYLSAAKLYQKYQNHPRVTFCLPEFVQSDTPLLQICGYWHPLINPDIVVSNDLIMDEGAANLIITGPNAGGKTTSIMSLMINVIFAQSFGIAPSTWLRLTPFAKIHSYLDITTNLQEGLSLFAAEKDRAKKLKASIQSCTPGQKTFTIIDEIFSGTDAAVASDIGFKFVKQLGEILHSMVIITTHFPRLTDLEKETNRFKNYKVADAIIAANGDISYSFKLVKGASTQNIAEHMLEHEGVL